MNRLYALASRAALVVAVLGMVGLAAIGLAMQRANDRLAEELALGDLVWASFQLDLELERTISALRAFAAQEAGMTTDKVNRQFDILWSRIGVFQAGDVGARLERYDSPTGAVGALFRDMQAVEPALVALATPAAAAAVAQRFVVHRPDIRAVAVAVNRGDAARRADLRERVSEGRDRAAAIGSGALVIACLLALFGLAEARRFRHLARKSAASARAAEAANVAKTRFLTMMSHELRTPMNGVLGLIALTRRLISSPDEDRLLAQAESSGKRMMEMIGDIIDYTDGDGRPLVVSPRPFCLSTLAETLAGKVEAANGQDGAPRLSIELSERAPRECVGDGARFGRALEHLSAYLLDTAGVQDVRVMIDHAEDELRVEISFNYLPEAEGRWRPERVLGPAAADDADPFAADPLGPTLARSFVAALGGRIELTTLYRGRTAMTVSAPMKAVAHRAPVVHLAMASDTMRMICASALTGAGVEVMDAQADGVEPTAILVDCADDDAAVGYVADLRAAHPAARLVALGAPRRPDLFDSAATVPIEVNALRTALLGPPEEAPEVVLAATG